MWSSFSGFFSAEGKYIIYYDTKFSKYILKAKTNIIFSWNFKLCSTARVIKTHSSACDIHKELCVLLGQQSDLVDQIQHHLGHFSWH